MNCRRCWHVTEMQARWGPYLLSAAALALGEGGVLKLDAVVGVRGIERLHERVQLVALAALLHVVHQLVARVVLGRALGQRRQAGERHLRSVSAARRGWGPGRTFSDSRSRGMLGRGLVVCCAVLQCWMLAWLRSITKPYGPQ